MSDWPWVVAAYALTWMVVGAYTLLVHRRLARARADLERERERGNQPREVEP